MEKTIFTKILLATLVLVSSVANAGFDNITDDLFGAYQNVTPGAAYESQNRYVLAGGSIVTRNPIQNINLVSVTPPSLTAGCRGITAYGGSFSFINKAQFTQLLRNIASNAVGYAFKLALSTLCPTCNSVMEKLASKINSINDLMQNSCKAAKSLVELGGTYQGMLDDAKESMSGVYSAAGSFSDYFEAGNDAETKTPKEVAQSNPAVNSTVTDPQNAVWFSLAETGVSNWFVDGSQDTKEILMSIVGTIIKNTVDAGGAACRAPDGAADDFCYTPYAATLSFKDILNGTFDKEGNARSINILRCDEPVNCLVVTPTATTSGFTGARERVRVLLIGDASNPGIIELIRSKGVLTLAQQRFIQSSRAPIKAMLMNVINDEGAMYMIANESLDVIAEQMTSDLVFQMVFAVRRAVSQAKPQMQTLMTKQVNEVLQEAQDARDQSAKKLTKVVELLKLNMAVRESVIASRKAGLLRGTGNSSSVIGK